MVAKDFMQFTKVSMRSSDSNAIADLSILAHDFSELMYGAHLFYNKLLQQKVFQNDHYDLDWSIWKSELSKTMIDYDRFDPSKLWQHATTTRPQTTSFVTDWWNEAKQGFSNEKKLGQLISAQEAYAKKGRARLQWNKVETVKENGWVGLTRFDYRFKQVKTILNDIITQLN